MSAAIPRQMKLPPAKLEMTPGEWKRYAQALERDLMLLRLAYERLKQRSEAGERR